MMKTFVVLFLLISESSIGAPFTFQAEEYVDGEFIFIGSNPHPAWQIGVEEPALCQRRGYYAELGIITPPVTALRRWGFLVGNRQNYQFWFSAQVGEVYRRVKNGRGMGHFARCAYHQSKFRTGQEAVSDIRRAFATHLLNAGAGPAQVRDLLGHVGYGHLYRYLQSSANAARTFLRAGKQATAKAKLSKHEAPEVTMMFSQATSSGLPETPSSSVGSLEFQV